MFIYICFIRRWWWWWSAYRCFYLGGLGCSIGAHLIWKIMLCMAILLYIMAIWDQGLFYNVPYFRLGLTAFYGPPAVHLHVAGRQEHCIIMSFPAPKCYFTGRGSFLKLHHFYNFPNFYFRHYYQQDFITYLECKQVWVMTTPPPPPRPPHRHPPVDSFLLMAPAAISDARVQTQNRPKHPRARAHALSKLLLTHVQPLQAKAAWPRCSSKAVIYKCVCAHACMCCR